jgi:PHD/YefM family antitoxin component YafN of YafNO toxin-antitoxin module
LEGCVAIPLTEKQQPAIDTARDVTQQVVDPRTGTAYVLIRAEEYETIRETLMEGRRQKAIRAVALRNAAGRVIEEP